MMKLYQANRQWSTRPEDERFGSLQAFYNATVAYGLAAKTTLRECRVEISRLNKAYRETVFNAAATELADAAIAKAEGR